MVIKADARVDLYVVLFCQQSQGQPTKPPPTLCLPGTAIAWALKDPELLPDSLGLPLVDDPVTAGGI